MSFFTTSWIWEISSLFDILSSVTTLQWSSELNIQNFECAEINLSLSLVQASLSTIEMKLYGYYLYESTLISYKL